MSLFNRLLVIIFGIGLIPILPTSLFLFYYQSAAKENILRLHKNIADMASIVIEEELEGFRDYVFMRAEKYAESGDKLKFLEDMVSGDKDVKFAALLDSGGSVLSRAGEDFLKRRFASEKFSSSSLFLRAKSAGKAQAGGFEVIYNVPIAVVFSPAGRGGRFVFAVKDLSRLFLKFKERKVDLYGKIYLSSLDGNLYRLTPNTPVVSPARIKKHLSSKDRIFRNLEGKDADYVGAFARIKEFSVAVLALEDSGVAFRGINLMTSLIIFFMLAIMTVFYFAAVSLSKRIMVPLMELMKGARLVSEKRFGEKLSERSDFREFTALLKSFNGMMGELERYKKMQVEKIVAEKKKLDILMAMMQDAVILSDFSGDPLYYNGTAKKILRALGSRSERDAIHRIITESRRSEYLETNVSGERKHFRPYVEILRHDRGKPAVFIVLRDITLEVQLNRMKEDFFHSVAHDVRVPLLTMQGNIKLLEKKCLDGKMKVHLENIKESSKQLFEFMRNILDISRLEAGGVNLSFSETSIRDFLEDIAGSFDVLFREKGVELRVSGEGDFKVKCDAALLRRVVENLLSNALKFTDKGGRVEVSYSRAGGRAEIRVSDTGRGIPPEKIGKIFDKYFQAGDGEAAAKGSGLGLAIARKIVEMHGGEIWAESESGKGSVFRIRLPGGL